MKKVLKPFILMAVGFYIGLCFSIIYFGSTINPSWLAALILFVASILLLILGFVKGGKGLFVSGTIVGFVGFVWFLSISVLWYITHKQPDDESFKILSDLFKLTISFASFGLFLAGFIIVFSTKSYKELKPREKKLRVENQQSDSEQEIQAESTKKSPSKFKRVLVNTKRINSFSYVGILKDYFGPGNENVKWINVEFRESRLLIYSNNNDDIYMSAADVESLEFVELTEWYSAGSVSAMDCVINIVGKDGKQGVIRTPIAKWRTAQDIPHLNTDSINRALKVLGASFRIDIKLYRVTLSDSRGQTKTDYRIAAGDEALNKECESLGEKLLRYDVIEKTPILYL